MFIVLYKEKIFQWKELKDRFIKLKNEMDRQQIAQQASQLKTKEDLLNLLNQIKKAEIKEMGLDVSMFRPFTEKQLNFYCNPNHIYHRYRQFEIKKKSGGLRRITAPRRQTFMMMLSAVNEMLKAIYTPSKYAMGFTDGRSVVTNAAAHKGQNYVFNIDLKDFFPSIHQARVWKRLQVPPFCFKQPIANLIAGLCAMKEVRKDDAGNTYSVYVLPQGAPTSPIITNMICDRLDFLLGAVAKRFGLNYSRYADDITFSSMHNVYQEGSAFRKELVRIINDQGFTINESKTRLQKKGARQEVTGIVVSDKLNVSQSYVRDIRNILYIWDRHGYGVAYNKFFQKYKEEKGHVKKGTPDLINVIKGKLLYLKMVKGEEDSVYKKLYAKFTKLADKDLTEQNTNNRGVTYIETNRLLDFEKKNSTNVILTQSWDECHHRCHYYAYFVLNNKRQLVSINKSLIRAEELRQGIIDKPLTADELRKEMLAISLCRGKDKKNFWLIHSQDKVTVPSPPHVDIDTLNTDLDSLLNI